MESSHKRCASCGLIKSTGEFNRRGRNIPALDSWCKACKHKSHLRWAANNPDKLKESGVDTRIRVRLKVLEHYGASCACCGESEVMFLTIDHINGGGTKHRESLGHQGRGNAFYRWLIKEQFPEGFRVLCHNCNIARGLYGFCPHE